MVSSHKILAREPSWIWLTRRGLVAMGFHWHCKVAQWTVHRSAARTWHMLMAAVFERLQNRVSHRVSHEEDQTA